MLAGDKKKIAGIIVSGMGSEKPKEEESSGEDVGKVAIAEAIVKAMKAGDAKVLASALSDFMELCDKDY